MQQERGVCRGCCGSEDLKMNSDQRALAVGALFGWGADTHCAVVRFAQYDRAGGGGHHAMVLAITTTARGQHRLRHGSRGEHGRNQGEQCCPEQQDGEQASQHEAVPIS